MASRLVAIHFLHEYELAAAMRAVKPIESGEAFVVGEADEASIDALRAKGIIVEELEEGRPPASGAPPPAPPAAAFRGLVPGPQRFRVLVRSQLLQTWRKELEARGEIVRRVSTREFVVRAEPARALEIAGLPFVERVVPLELAQAARAMKKAAPPPPAPPPPPHAAVVPPPAAAAPRLPPPPSSARAAAAPPPAEPFTVDVVVADGASATDLARWLEGRGDVVKAAAGRKLRVELAGGEDAIEEVRARRDVEAAQRYLRPELFNDLGRALVGLDDPAGARRVPYTGAGEIVAVADTGIDAEHPDLAGQLLQDAVPLGRPASGGKPARADDPDGHGTHVAGTIAGTGLRSGGRYAGVAPGARLFFQSLLDADGGLGGIPLELGKLFQDAYDAGARIHNDSWGAKARALYTIDASEVDDFVARRRDMLVVVAAGNAAVANDPTYRKAGTVDLESMCSPATSKNALVVGASRSTRTSGGAAAETYGVRFAPRFPAPIGAERISGDGRCLAAFSSRGYDGIDKGVKPDVVAPGTDVLSTRSRLAPFRKFWAACETSDDYAYLGGTSMAAPFVAGAAALVREHYRKDRSHDPSAALVKATLVNGTRWLDGPDALESGSAPPNSDQGFGLVHLATTLPGPADPALRLEFLDTWKDAARQFTHDNQTFKYDIDVQPGRPLRLCLAYTDAAASSLQNDLNLVVESPGRTRKWLGNGRVTRIGVPIPDRGNNVEVVRIDAPEAGKYLVRISSKLILKRPQDFALVATGALSSPFVPRS
jgi:serine protease AprX